MLHRVPLVHTAPMARTTQGTARVSPAPPPPAAIAQRDRRQPQAQCVRWGISAWAAPVTRCHARRVDMLRRRQRRCAPSASQGPCQEQMGRRRAQTAAQGRSRLPLELPHALTARRVDMLRRRQRRCAPSARRASTRQKRERPRTRLAQSASSVPSQSTQVRPAAHATRPPAACASGEALHAGA